MANNYILFLVLLGAFVFGATIVSNVRYWMKSQRYRRDRIWFTFSIAFVLWLCVSNARFLFHVDPMAHSTIAERMIEWFFFAQFYSLYLIYRKRRACINSFRVLLLLLPFLSVLQSMLTFKVWSEGYQAYESLLDVILSGTLKEKTLYAISFFITLVSPLANIFLPFMVDRTFKLSEVSFLSKKYFTGMFICGMLYMFAVIYDSPFLLVSYRIALSIFIFVMTLEFIRVPKRDNSLPVESKEFVDLDKTSEDLLSATVRALAAKVNLYMADKKPYVDPEYNIRKLVVELNTNQSMLERAIHALGYSSFRDYICDLRIDHFKKLAAESPGASISVLMYESGFNSRATFYRRYSEKENTSPKEYVANLFRKVEDLPEAIIENSRGKSANY